MAKSAQRLPPWRREGASAVRSAPLLSRQGHLLDRPLPSPCPPPPRPRGPTTQQRARGPAERQVSRSPAVSRTDAGTFGPRGAAQPRRPPGGRRGLAGRAAPRVPSPALRSRTPLHCAASCNSVHLCKQLVESGAAIFASTISDIETAADKCEETEEGYIQCSQFLYGTRGVLARGGGPSPGRGAAGPGRSPLPFWEPPRQVPRDGSHSVPWAPS